MRLTATDGAISRMISLRERTRILRHGGRSGKQQYIDRGFGREENVDFEALHYRDI